MYHVAAKDSVYETREDGCNLTALAHAHGRHMRRLSCAQSETADVR
jgi:hypothetical protein